MHSFVGEEHDFHATTYLIVRSCLSEGIQTEQIDGLD